MDAQMAVRIHTDNSPEMTHLAVWIPTDNNTIQIGVPVSRAGPLDLNYNTL